VTADVTSTWQTGRDLQSESVDSSRQVTCTLLHVVIPRAHYSSDLDCLITTPAYFITADNQQNNHFTALTFSVKLHIDRQRIILLSSSINLASFLYIFHPVTTLFTYFLTADARLIACHHSLTDKYDEKCHTSVRIFYNIAS